VADWDMMFDFVDDIKTILEDNLEANLILEASTTYKLPMGDVLDYEVNVADRDPTMIILPESMGVENAEAESEILLGNVNLWVILRGTQRRYPRRLFLYEKAIRKTIFENRRQGADRMYWITDSVYGLERTMGGRVIKDMMLTIMCRGQFDYS
jgi:hypothetical protein